MDKPVMIERPILFSGPMVRAILAGAKTQTRRVVKYVVTGPNPPNTLDFRLPDAPSANGKLSRMRGWQGALDATTRKGNALLLCPYGQPGDRLWVRETGWERPIRMARDLREGADTWEKYYYDADGLSEGDHEQFKAWGFKRRPSIHMPRWASRITLEVTGVRVEQLQDISRKDAAAEGICYPESEPMPAWYRRSNWPEQNFAGLWDSINAKRAPWESNPWVWVISFERLP